MKFSVGLCIFLGAILAVVVAQRGNFRQFNNNFNNNNNNNFRPNNNFNNFRPQQNNFRPQQQNNFRQFNNNNNNNNNFQQRQQQPAQQNQNFAFGLDTSDGRYAKFNGPVRGLPHGHGGGRYGAADCLLCPNGF